MEFRPRLPEEGINVSRTHPLREALLLVGGVLAVAALVVVMGALAVDLLVPHVPARWEVRMFGALWSDADEDDLDEEARRQRAELQTLVDRLAAHWPDSPYPFRISVLEESTPNALAFPGGLIGVTSGLLEGVESENEFAFVLAHELGHFRHRHHLRSLGRGVVLSVVVSVVLGGGGTSASELLELAPMLAERSFAREQEREADEFGLELVYLEYGHVAAAGDFFERIATPKTRLVRQVEGYFSTHPVNLERIEDLETLAREHDWPRSGELRPFSN